MTLIQPPPARPFPPQRRDETRQLLEDAARATLRRRRRRWLSRTTIAVGAAALLTTGGVATAYVGYQNAHQTTDVRCYTKVVRDEGEGFPGTTVTTRGTGSNGRTAPADPVRACADLWRQGVLRPGARTAGDVDGRTHRVPPLQACVLDDGTAAVYPAADERTCAGLGLPRLRR